MALAGAAGCAHLLGGRATGPHGQASWDRELRTLMAGGSYGRALSLVGPDSSRAGDELLRLQHRGLVAHYAGRWRESADCLERALVLAEDRYTRSVSKALLSLVTSDRVLPYRPPRPERLLLHYYGALNYLRMGEPDEAAVEARRLGRLLERSRRDEGGGVPRELAEALSHFSGAVFEAAGQPVDAAVAYRRARAFAPRAGDSAAAPAGGGGGAGAAPGEPPGPALDEPSPPTGQVLVAVERGFVAHRVERSVTLFLLPCEVDRLREARSAALEEDEEADADPVLEVARRVADRSLGWEPGPGRVRGHRCEEDADPVLLRVAWPAFRETPTGSGEAVLRVDGEPRPADPVARVDVSEAVREAYRGRRLLDLAKTLLRAVTKVAVAEGIEDAVSDGDETLGEVAGWTARVAGALLERADTRSWHSLPARIDLYRLRLPAATHRLEVEVPRAGGASRRVGLGEVEVAPGRTRVLAARAWR